MSLFDVISGGLLSFSRSNRSSYSYEAEERRIKRSATVHDIYTDTRHSINVNDIFYMYIEKDGKYTIKHRDIGVIQVSEDAYINVSKRVDDRFVQVYDIDNDRFVIFNKAGVRAVYEEHNTGDYIIRVGGYGKFKTHYDYYYLVCGLLGKRDRSFTEFWFGAYNRPKYSLYEIREIVRSSRDKKVSP